MQRLQRTAPHLAMIWVVVFSLLLGLPAGGFVVPVSAAAEAAEAVDMEFSNASLVQVLQMLAESAGYNVLLDDTVQGKITFTLRDVKPMEALDLVTGITGYKYEIVGNTIVVGSSAKFPEPTPVVTDVALVAIQDVALDRAADLVRELYPGIGVIKDSDTRTLILRGEKPVVAEAQSFLAGYDRPTDRALQFQGASVDTILWELAGRAKWNLVIEGQLQGQLTANLDGMDYVDALGLIGDAAGLHYRLSERVLFVSQPDGEELLDKAKEVALFRLDYVNSEKTAETLRAMYPELEVDVNELSRTLTVAGEADDLTAATQLVRQLDVPRPQVLIEARVEEIHVDALQRLGLEWELPSFMGEGTPDAFALTWSPAALRALLDALSDQGTSKILASPKLAAVDGESADILIGDRIPIMIRGVDAEGRAIEMIEFIEAGIKMEIVPTVARDGSVMLTIFTQVSSITGFTAQNVPEIRTREASTTVRLQDGQPLIIGGLIQEEERQRLSGIPFLSDLPLLGRLFSRNVDETIQTEMVIFLIPHIVHDNAFSGHSGAGGTSNLTEGGGAEQASAPSPGSAGDSGGYPGLPSLQELLAKRLREPVDELSVAWFDVTNLAGYKVLDVEFERRRDGRSLLTDVYLGDTAAGLAWGAGLSTRRYGEAMAGVTPWAGVGVEYVQPSGGDDSGFIVSAQAGVGTGEGAPLHLELYGKYSIAGGGLSLPSDNLPARDEGLWTGLRLGWQY